MPVVAGTCSSRIVFNVPDAHSTGVEFELTAAPTDRFDFGISASYTESEIDTSVTSTSGGVTSIVAGIEEGNRLPSVPEFQLSANATYSWPMGERVDGFITGVYQHVGSRYTQIADQADGFGTFGIRGYRRPRRSPSSRSTRCCRPTTSATCVSACAATTGKPRCS